MKVTKADQLAVNNLRMLSVEMIEQAGSGHPGLPLGAAPMMWCLWSRHLRINSHDPQWFNRDRFVLSAGHGSVLLYSMLHLAGFDLTIDDLKHFRQFGSRTPGHPEYGEVPGVEATTGPLGQGLGMAVGMALTERFLAAKYNQSGKKLIDHYTYALVGDGDLMEGVSHEVASFAGRQQLQKLIVLYDSNDVSLDGPTSRSFKTDVCQRFASYGWNTQMVADGNDLAAIDQALTAAKQTAAPSLIEVRTTIGYGAPNAGTNQVHGQPLGKTGLAVLRENLAWNAPAFTVLPEVAQIAQQLVRNRGQNAAKQWQQQVAELALVDSAALADFKQLLTGQTEIKVTLPRYESGAESGRDTSHQVIQALAQQNPNLVGGSADLATSNRTTIENSSLMTPEKPTGRNLAFGVREFGEGTILNGMALHGGVQVFGATFLVFSDYLRPAVRLAALQKLPVTFIFTHDSLAVGEDGPTHQPIEQLMSLRQIPGVEVFRPADPNEVMAAWNQAVSVVDHPTILILSRQQLAVLPNTNLTAERGVDHGGYVIASQKGVEPTGILLATGSEVALALQVQKRLLELGQDVSVVSMPSMERFSRQSVKYQAKVLPPQIRRRVAIELGTPQGWEKYVGLDGKIAGVTNFGASGAMEDLLAAAGFSVDRIVQIYQQIRPEDEESLSVIG